MEGMFELRVLELAKDRLKNDAQLLSILGENFEMFHLFGDRKPKFPYIVHRVNTKFSTDPVVTGNYYLDLWDYGLDRARLYAAVRRIRILMEGFMDTSGGGIRFYVRDCVYSTLHEKIQKAEMIYHVRGVDKDQCREQTIL